jgi:hypothetical protein
LSNLSTAKLNFSKHDILGAYEGVGRRKTKSRIGAIPCYRVLARVLPTQTYEAFAKHADTSLANVCT